MEHIGRAFNDVMAPRRGRNILTRWMKFIFKRSPIRGEYGIRGLHYLLFYFTFPILISPRSFFNLLSVVPCIATYLREGASLFSPDNCATVIKLLNLGAQQACSQGSGVGVPIKDGTSTFP